MTGQRGRGRAQRYMLGCAAPAAWLAVSSLGRCRAGPCLCGPPLTHTQTRTSSQAATRSMRLIVSSSSASWGAVTQWMQLTGHVSMASCASARQRHWMRASRDGNQLPPCAAAWAEAGWTRALREGGSQPPAPRFKSHLQTLHAVHALLAHPRPPPLLLHHEGGPAHVGAVAAPAAQGSRQLSRRTVWCHEGARRGLQGGNLFPLRRSTSGASRHRTPASLALCPRSKCQLTIASTAPHTLSCHPPDARELVHKHKLGLVAGVHEGVDPPHLKPDD